MGVALLSGVRIVDMTSVVFGPYATQMMADLGAEVIKVEPPEGDHMRLAGKPSRSRGMGPCHLTLNRGKRSMVLDLKSERDAETMRALLRTADVFIHNVRTQAIAQLGFDHDAVRALKPDILYVHCTGFGQDGPYRDLQAYDDVIQAASGAATLAGRVDGSAAPRYLPSLIADKVAGLYGAQAILAGLYHRLASGVGEFIEVPMFILEEHLFGATLVPPVGGVGYPRQLDPARQPFRTADGWVSIVPYTDANLLHAFGVLGRPDIGDDPRYATPRDRALRMSELYAAIAELTPARTTAFWLEGLRAARVPCMPVRDLADITSDPHLEAVGFFRTRTHPTEGEYREMQPPIRFAGLAQTEARPAPLLGEHTEQVRAELLRDGWLTADGAA
jgi:crotonobetainyl-CoA:carnitine CoA-transferase CaiB-like acyl-CoA transferase